MVELSPGKFLFALLGEGSTKELATRTFKDQLPYDPDESWAKIETLRETHAINPDDYPLLVTFTDINNPTSVKEVNPADLAATFGQGYRLKDITLEITDEKVTEGIAEATLPWLKNLRSNLDGSQNPNPQFGLSRNLNGGNFMTRE